MLGVGNNVAELEGTVEANPKDKLPVRCVIDYFGTVEFRKPKDFPLNNNRIKYLGGKSEDKKKTRAAKFAEKFAWKLEPPASGEPTTKDVDKKTYHFCPHHNNGIGAWVIHHPSKCDRRDTKPKDKTASDKIMSLTKALQAIHEESGDASSDDEE